MPKIPSGPLGERSSAAMLAAAQAGCFDALGALMQSYRTYLMVVSERELGADLQVKVSPSDLVQETFAAGQQAIRQFRGSTPEEFQAWLRGILLNKLAQARRRYLGTAARDLKLEDRGPDHSSIAAQAELLVDDDTPSKHAMLRENKFVVRTAINRLPDHYRQVIELRNFGLLSFQEIAGIMNRSPHELRALWLRAVRRLKKELHELEEE